MPVSFDLNNVDGLDDRLANAAAELERLLGAEDAKAKIAAAMKLVTDDAKARVHSITGHLAAGIKTTITTAADAPTVIETGISYARTRAHHAHLVEGGHGGPHPAPPHPFWAPAVTAYGDEAAEKLEQLAQELMMQALNG